MRTQTLFAVFASLVLAPLAAHAGRLDIAVMQYSDKRDPAAVAAALKTIDLVKVTDSDRVESNVPGIRAGWVIFAQSLNVTPGQSFANSTRLTNQRADVTGSLNGTNLSVDITILHGVKIGIRKYSQATYSGSGSVAGGVPQLISIAQSSGKTADIKGRIISFDETTVIAALYRP